MTKNRVTRRTLVKAGVGALAAPALLNIIPIASAGRCFRWPGG